MAIGNTPSGSAPVPLAPHFCPCCGQPLVHQHTTVSEQGGGESSRFVCVTCGGFERRERSKPGGSHEPKQ